MKHIVKIFESIKNESSRNGKEAILKANINDQELKNILEYTYNPYKVFGIGKKGFAKKYQGKECGFTNIIQLLDYLLANPNGSDYSKGLVNSFIESQPVEHQEWLKKIVLKDLKIGITEKTINKIWKGLVPTFDVMLAHPIDRLPKRVGVEIKFDGVRATAVKINGSTQLYTRNGKDIEGFDSILEQLNALPLDNYVFDGELISNNSWKKTMNKVFKKGKNKEADFMMFDMLPLGEFNNGKSKKTYEQRRSDLASLFDQNLFSKNFFKIEYEVGQNLQIAPVMGFINEPTISQLDIMCQQAVLEGYEGIMVKDMDSFYVCKRDYGWQKMKLFEEGEFEIIRVEEGEEGTENEGRMGSLILDVNGVEVGLGTGWSRAERIDAWNNPNKYIGRFVEIQYQRLIEESGSLLFPSVKGIRWDK